MFKSGFDTGNTLDITYLLEKYLKIKVTTDYIATVIPEFTSVYGSGKQVQISAKYVTAPGSVAVTPDMAELKVSLAGTFKVGDSVALQGQLDNIDFGAFIKAVNGVLSGNISKHSMGQVSNFQTSLGLSADQFITELQGNINKYIAKANSDLAAGIKIQSILGINVSDVEVNFNQGYIEGGINATPEFFVGAQNLWTAYKQEVDRIRAGEFPTTKYTFEEVTSFLQ